MYAFVSFHKLSLHNPLQILDKQMLYYFLLENKCSFKTYDA